MERVLLDSNFILSCVQQKIDFFEYLESEGIKALVPKQVVGEIKKLSTSQDKSLKLKESAKLALQILSMNKFKILDLGMKNVDSGILNFAETNPNVIIGTLDQRIKRAIPNSKLVIRGKKKLEIIT